MSKSDSRLFVGTAGAKITCESISAHREKFLGKTVGQIDKMIPVSKARFTDGSCKSAQISGAYLSP